MKEQHDVIIVGAGPGGLQVAITLMEQAKKQNKNLNLLVFESGDKAGTSFTKFPVHGQLISNNKLYTGKPSSHRFSERFDWNSLITEDKQIQMRNYSTDFFPKREALVQMLNDIVDYYQIPVKYNTKWLDTSRNEHGNYTVETTNGTYKTQHLVVATGMKPKKAEILGIEHATPYEVMKEKEFYRDKRVLIIGKGNSGMECAQDILNEANVIMLASPTSLNLAYKTHYVGHVRAVNALLVDNYQLKHQAALLDCEIEKIEPYKDGMNVTVKYVHAEGEVEQLYFDEIIAATGFMANIEPLSSLNIDTLYNGKYPVMNEEFESTRIPNLYFAGTQTHGLDYKRTFSGFIHGFRYNSKILAHHLANKLGFGADNVLISDQDIKNYILDEFNHSPDLYLQPGYIVKVFKIDNEKWKELGHFSLDKFNKMEITIDSKLIAISLEYGDIHRFSEVLSIPRVPGDVSQSAHIHPIIRVRDKNNLDGKMYELEEDLENEYLDDPKYHEALQSILVDIKGNSKVSVS